MISLSAGRRFPLRSLGIPALLLGVLAICVTTLAPSSLPAQTKGKPEDGHKKLLAKDLEVLFVQDLQDANHESDYGHVADFFRDDEVA